MSLTPDQIQIIKSTVPVLAEHGYTITKTMYSNMITQNPGLRDLFNRSSQTSGKQSSALAAVLHAYAANIDNLAALTSTVERICQKHASLYLQPSQYDIVGTHLIAAFKTVLGSALTPEILEAWTAAYGQIASIMISREKELYSHGDDWLSWRNFTVLKKIQESSQITSFYLSPVDKKPLPEYTPGQYISIQIPVPELGYAQSRQFSLSDSPNHRDYYRISVKRELEIPGGERHYVTNLLHDSKEVGDIVEVSHPQGDFLLEDIEATTPLVLISAGIGLTPLLSMLNTTVASKSSRSVSWIHAARDTSVQAFGQNIQQVCKENSNVRARVFVKNPVVGRDVEGVDYHVRGRFDLSWLREQEVLGLEDEGTMYYVCGPKSFMRAVRSGLFAFGVGGERVKFEVFGHGELE